MPESNACGGDNKIVRTDHLTTLCQFGPKSRMNPCLRQIERNHGHPLDRLFDVSSSFCFPNRIRCALNSMQKLRRRYRRHQCVSGRDLTKEPGHVKLTALVRDEDRGIED